MKKVIYQKHNVNIAIGASSYSSQIQLERGNCIGVKVIDFTPAVARTNEIALNIQSTDGSRTVGESDYRDFIALGGGYLEGLKPVSFDTKPMVNISVNSSANIAGTAFAIQVIFAIEVETY